MLSENLKTLRRPEACPRRSWPAGSMWCGRPSQNGRKGLSVPDAELLVRLSEELDTTVTALLGPALPQGAEPMPSRPSWPPSMSSWRYGTAGPGGSGRWWPVC